jgi:hypothetical protein
MTSNFSRLLHLYYGVIGTHLKEVFLGLCWVVQFFGSEDLNFIQLWTLIYFTKFFCLFNLAVLKRSDFKLQYSMRMRFLF